MSLEDNRGDGLKKPITERRAGVPQTETQRIASVENFALFLLKGIKSQIGNPRAVMIFHPEIVRLINTSCDMEIDRIKSIQDIRKKYK